MSAKSSGCQIAAPEALLDEARRRTGIEVIDHEAEAPLRVLIKSFNESGLHAEGAAMMQTRLVRILSNRLRMQRDLAAHPEIMDEVIDAPIFICGMARTGSTKTHKLLAVAGDFNWLPYWEVINPSLITGDRTESPRERIDDTEAFARWFDAASPETRAGHSFETHEPEEESFVLEHSLRTPTFMGWAPLSEYLAWLLTQDFSLQFRHLRTTLKYLQWQGLATSKRRWVLKCPLYSGLEPLILDLFPDASLVMTHRHPAITVPSGLRLLECFYRPYTTCPPDPVQYVPALAAGIDGHLKARAALPEDTFLDIDFASLARDVAREMERIYRFAGVELSPAARDRMIAWDLGNPQHKRGVHRYTLEQFGLSRETIDREFAGYIHFLEHRLPLLA